MSPFINKRLQHFFADQRWLIFPLLLFALSIALQARGTYEPLNNWLLDQRMAHTSVAPSQEVAIIAIDPQSLKDIGTWPWSRSVHADLLDGLVDLGAGAVLFDVDFAFASDAQGDKAFADALDRAGGATLLPAFLQRGLDGTIVANQSYPPFYERSWPALVTVTPQENGQIRTYPTGTYVDGLFVPSAGVQLAGSYASDSDSFVINFGISPDTIPVFSASDLLNGNLLEEDIAGRSVLVGAAAAELGDHFAVPLHRVVPGVMVHALATETLLQDASVTQIPSIWLLGPLFIILLGLNFVGRKNAWGLVSLAFLASFGVELVAAFTFSSSYNTLSTAMFHPALIMLAIGRLATIVDLSRILIKRQEVQVENAERLRQHIFENSSDGFLAINGQGGIVFQSDVASALLGYGKLHPIILRTAQRVFGQMGESPILDSLEIETPAGMRSVELHANGSEFQGLDNGNNFISEPLALITLRDVTDLKQKERHIEYLSLHDDRTSALRRHSFADAIESRRGENETFSVVAIALRRLTAINATLGRDIGDKIIAEAVTRLRDPSLGLGEVARLEGNILGVIIPRSDTDLMFQDRCQQVSDALAKPYLLAGSHIQVGVGIGYLTTDPTQNWDGEDYISRAQDALASAVNSVSSTPTLYDSAEGEQRKRSRRLEHALKQALARDEFHLLYQPQYRLSDQSLIGAEALIRWESPEFGTVRPDEFIPIAESSGFITELGHFVLERAIESAVALPKHLVMSPNVSVFQILSDNFPLQVAKLLKKYSLSPERLCLELTESEYLSPESEAVEHMTRVKSLGVSWALDDFGTGYSSLSYLKDLPFDKIKLDRAFLKDILSDPKSQTTLKSLVQLVHGYGKTLLCEGAETQKEVALLTRIGCDSVQGYYFGRPETFEEMCKRARSEIDWESMAFKEANLA